MAQTVAAKRKKAAVKKKGAQTDHDHGLERVYTRLKPADKKRLDKAADQDQRSTMQYLERLILKHLEQVEKRRK